MTAAAQVVTRSLSPTQAATRRRLIEAARDLATEGGYEAVGMRAVAARAGVSAPTAYLYFSSKDHLLVDLLVLLVEETTAELAAHPSRARSPIERTVATLRRAVENVERTPNLYIAATRAFISGSPEVAHASAAMESSTRSWIDLAVGDHAVGDRNAIVRILDDVLFANMVGLITGVRSPGEISDDLALAVRTLMSPAH
jgi:AcrR family transcriptional regulator